ncbi:MAG TPA: four helix bundle protein [Candidatus Wunengus sp. YC60]|uniref:four helix bundle protein n=1 Tax=Candidatus Wunengus sp. YC60 TaxID=3367697 RepID=UPI004027C530
MEYNVEFENGEMVVMDKVGNYKIDLRECLVDFAVNTIKFLGTIHYRKEYDVIRYQLSKAATSIGANYEESQASTPKEFHAKVSISLRESRETCFWYKIIDRLNLGSEDMRRSLIQESKEISLIMGSIASKTR